VPAPARLRERVDACPGVFAPHDAADGALARVRLPGGAVDAAALRVVAGCAEELGDGRVHLTSRGNLQLRGLTRTPALAERLTEAGLLPSVTHERVRNVLASPLSGIAGGVADVRGMAAALDRGLCARPGLAALPGRFLFALDDGRGDVAAEEPDLCWQAVSARAVPASSSGPASSVDSTTTGVLRVAGVAVAAVDAADAVPALLEAAEAFLALRAADGGTAWRASELPAAPARVAAALGLADAASVSRVTPLALTVRGVTLLTSAERAATTGAVPGPVRRDDGDVALVVAPLLGELTADQVRLLADAALPASGPTAVVTPWRTAVLPDPGPPAAHLAAAGLVVAPGPAADVSACAGRPGCAKALADVRADVRAVLSRTSGPPAGRVHVSGCARRCGAPRTAHVDAVAQDGGGYLVDGVLRAGPVP
jgi:precorrin-3B synthase